MNRAEAVAREAIRRGDPETLRAVQQNLKRVYEAKLAKEHPAYLLDHVKMVDEKDGTVFEFHLLDSESGWFWQREVLNDWIANKLSIILKARQLGVTWLAAGYGLWIALAKPGTLILVYRQTEDDAALVVGRIWDMWLSLPEHLRFGVKVIKPKPGHSDRPHTEIHLLHPDGRISRIKGETAREVAGHGETAALVIVDEASRIEKFRGIWTALVPTVGKEGSVIVLSTANGLSNPETGEGNFFHRLWVTAEDKGLTKIFLGWFKHPERTQEWYDTSSEVRSLDDHARAEQYPSNPTEAFALTNETFFDREAIKHYASEAVRMPFYRGDFMEKSPGVAKLKKNDKFGKLAVYEEPAYHVEQTEEGPLTYEHTYAISADVSTGRARDYSVAYVINLQTMAIAAELRGKFDGDEYAEQLHYLGKWYRDAKIAVEASGGWGETVLVALRDGRSGRRAYPNLYRHRQFSRPDQPESHTYGFPMTIKTRPLVLDQLEEALREKQLPWVPEGLLEECQTFVHRNKKPTPAAADGANDDRVMAAAIGMEMYRQFGHQRLKKSGQRAYNKRKRPYVPPYPWQQ